MEGPEKHVTFKDKKNRSPPDRYYDITGQPHLKSLSDWCVVESRFFDQVKAKIDASGRHPKEVERVVMVIPGFDLHIGDNTTADEIDDQSRRHFEACNHTPELEFFTYSDFHVTTTLRHPSEVEIPYHGANLDVTIYLYENCPGSLTEEEYWEYVGDEADRLVRYTTHYRLPLQYIHEMDTRVYGLLMEKYKRGTIPILLSREDPTLRIDAFSVTFWEPQTRGTKRDKGDTVS